jgi:hypothetical protein
MKLLIPLLIFCCACQKKYTPPELYSKLVGEWISIDQNRPSTVAFKENVPRVTCVDRFNSQTYKIYAHQTDVSVNYVGFSFYLTKNKVRGILLKLNKTFDTITCSDGQNIYGEINLKKSALSYTQIYVKK